MTIQPARERFTVAGIAVRIIHATQRRGPEHDTFFLMKEPPGPFFYLVVYRVAAWRCTCWQPKPCAHEIDANAIYLAKHCQAAYPGIPEEDLIAHIEDELRQANAHKLDREAYTNEFGIYQ